MSGIAGPKIVTSGLVLALDAANKNSYPGTGTTWYDLTGNGNNVTATNSPVWNSSGYWANTSTSYFTGAGTSSIPTGNSQYTMICWARQRVADGWGAINNGFMSIGGFGTNNQSNAIRASVNTVGYLIHYWWNNDLSLSNNNAGLALGVWFMLGASFDGTTRRIWLNGNSVVSDTPLNHNVTSTTIQISKTYSVEYQSGDMAAAYIYNRAITSSEMQQNFNANRSRFGL